MPIALTVATNNMRNAPIAKPQPIVTCRTVRTVEAKHTLQSHLEVLRDVDHFLRRPFVDLRRHRLTLDPIASLTL